MNLTENAREPKPTGVEKPRIIFFGTPEFAAPCLKKLFDIAEVALVVTQPDRAAGRGLKTGASPIKIIAERRGIALLQPEKVRTAEFAEMLRATGADLGIVAAYGRILPPSVLQAPRLGCVNIHASLLPKLRGAAPIEWAIINGETETGVSLMQLDEGLDTGPVYATQKIAIDPEENAAELSEKLALLGADLLADFLPDLARGKLKPQPQDHARATTAPILSKQDGRIKWRLSARNIHNLVRGVTPWPGAFTWLNDRRIILHKVKVTKETGQFAEPGTILRADSEAFEVACGSGALKFWSCNWKENEK